MEKSIEFGFEHYIQKIPGMSEIDAKECSPLVLAYIGDCVFDLIIKTMAAGRGNRPVHKLHEETSRYVQASAQSFMMRSMQEHLTEEEHAIYRRGRNSRTVSPAKNQSITDYRRATGFEALIGYLYLRREYERLTELVALGLESMENNEGSKDADKE
ncbi:MAG: Mini-ribonuclease 3 [Mediterraneibacter sp.]|jgi:ribonuclease-3 family protein